VLAAIRPDDWNFPLLLHVLGAMLLVGGLATAVAAQVIGWRPAPGAALSHARAAFRALVLVALPGWVLMRVAGQWIASKEGFDGGDEPAWLGIGYITSEAGAVLLLASIVLAGLGARRLRTTAGETSTLARISGVLAGVLVLAYLVTIWAMTTKPD
jgi:hypothetical protein